jgi:hypothetical protein
LDPAESIRRDGNAGPDRFSKMDATMKMPKPATVVRAFRFAAILAWLRDHTGVTRFAVLDDEDDELDGLPLFQPSACTGLTKEMAHGLVDYLEDRTDKDMRSSRLGRMFQNLHAIRRGCIEALGDCGENALIGPRRRPRTAPRNGAT